MTSLPYNPADSRPVSIMWGRLFRLHPQRTVGRFLRGLLPSLLWGVGLLTVTWIVDLIVKPEWAYPKVVQAMRCAVASGPTVCYVGGVLRSIWGNQRAGTTARANDLRHGKRRRNR